MTSTRTHAVGAALTVLLLSIMGTVGGTASAEEGDRSRSGHREVILERVGDSFRVVSQALRRSAASQQHRTDDRSPGYRVSARSQDGAVVATVAAADATEVHYDYRPEGAADGDLAGGTVAKPNGRVVVQLPADVAIDELELTGKGVDSTVALAPLPVAQAAPAAAPPATTIIDNGAATSHVDIVFVGDGYTSAELPTYRADVQRFTDHLFTQAPFSQYATFFNVHRVDLESNQSGTDNTCTGTSVDTALDTAFQATASDCRLLWTSSSAKVYAAAAGAPSADVIAVLVNTPTYGGAATYGGYGVFYRGTDGPEVMAHELGHSFGLLADEYVEGGTDYTGGEPSQLNITTQANRGLIKWRDWIAPTTPVPTTSSTPDIPGLYEGASQYQRGIYRPTYDSKMRSLNRPFDRVNSALLVDRIFDFAQVDTTPPSGSVTQAGPVAGNGQVPLSLSYTDAGSYVSSYQLSNYNDFRDSSRLPASNAATFGQTIQWTPLAGAGTKTIWARVTNGSGEATTQSLVLQSGAVTVPGVPGGFSMVTDDAARSATISWVPPTTTGGAAITGYRVERSAGGGKAAWSTTLAASARSATFLSLTPGTAFTLSVQAVNAQGAGPAASGVVTITGTATAPGAPVIGTAAAGTAGGAITATARWSAPSSTGGSPITGYRVRALRMSSTGAVLATTTSSVQPSSAGSLSMTLPQTGNYRFTVAAINAVAAGAQSARSNQVAGR